MIIMILGQKIALEKCYVLRIGSLKQPKRYWKAIQANQDKIHVGEETAKAREKRGNKRSND